MIFRRFEMSKWKWEQSVAVFAAVAAAFSAGASYWQADIARKAWREQALLVQQIDGCSQAIESVRGFGIEADRYRLAYESGADRQSMDHAYSRFEEQYIETQGDISRLDVFFPPEFALRLNEVRQAIGEIGTEVASVQSRLHAGERAPMRPELTAAINQKWHQLRNACYAEIGPGRSQP